MNPWCEDDAEELLYDLQKAEKLLSDTSDFAIAWELLHEAVRKHIGLSVQ